MRLRVVGELVINKGEATSMTPADRLHLTRFLRRQVHHAIAWLRRGPTVARAKERLRLPLATDAAGLGLGISAPLA